MGQEIESHMRMNALNLIGKDTLKKFLALLQGADVIISPDSGPAHMATGLGTPVIGLYAASNPRRSGPYFSQRWCVDKYGVAAQTFKNKSENELKWGTKLEYQGVMNLITVDDVISRLDILCSNQQVTDTKSLSNGKYKRTRLARRIAGQNHHTGDQGGADHRC